MAKAKGRAGAGRKGSGKPIRGRPWKAPKGASATFTAGDGQRSRFSWTAGLK